MSESKVKFREALGRYVQVLQDQGVRRVPLDRQAREVLRGMRVAPAKASAPLPTQAPPASPIPVVPARTVAAAPKPAAAPASAPAPSAPASAVAVSVSASGSKQARLDRLAAKAKDELKDVPGDTFRNNFVFGEGSPDARIVFVGEAPGAEEDKLGRPFVGRAGQLLNKMIEAMGLKRDEVYIANILKFRPSMPEGAPGNRKPTPEEMATCLPYVLAQIEILAPGVIVALGSTSVEGLLGPGLPISRIRGKFVDFRGIALMPTFHPSYLLHNPTNETKRKVWEDLMQVMEKTGMPISEKQRGFFL